MHTREESHSVLFARLKTKVERCLAVGRLMKLLLCDECVLWNVNTIVEEKKPFDQLIHGDYSCTQTVQLNSTIDQSRTEEQTTMFREPP
ncbi:hypothetical protein V3C99_000395 [Haemonchus contortus]